MRSKKSFSFQLLQIFLISTLIPFMLVTSVIAHIYTREYNRDMQQLLNSTISSLTSNLTTYLHELEYVTLQPYYNNELYTYLRKLSDGYEYNSLEKLSLQNTLNSNMSFVRYIRKDTNGIFIVKNSKCLYYTVNRTDRRTLTPDFDYAAESWYQEAIDADGRSIIIGTHIPQYIKPYDTAVISLVRSIVVLESREPLYVIKIDINPSIFDSIFKEFNFHVDSKIIIRDKNNQILYANQALHDEEKDLLSNINPIQKTVSLQDGKWNIYDYALDPYGWNISILLSASQLGAKTRIIYFTAIILYVIGLVMAVFSHILFTQKMVHSIAHMKGIFLSIQNGDFTSKYSYCSNTELDDLGSSLNDMAQQLSNRIQTEYIMTIQQKDVEFQALQAQIQPHFLFNALNNFIALNQLGDRESLENALYELSQMMRYILKAPATIPLSMELSFIRDYCSLQKLRFSERLEYMISMDESVGKIHIPKLLLQPIVENSILHGIEPCNHSCLVDIRITKEESGILIVISDTGVGCSMAELDRHDSIGLSNVEERLHIFSPKSSFQMSSTLGEGTCTIIHLFISDMEAYI